MSSACEPVLQRQRVSGYAPSMSCFARCPTLWRAQPLHRLPGIMPHRARQLHPRAAVNTEQSGSHLWVRTASAIRVACLARAAVAADAVACYACQSSLPRFLRTCRQECWVLGSYPESCTCAGLYKGVTLSAAGVVPYLAVSFAVYDELKAMLPASKAARLEWWYPVAKIGIGATAAVIAQACLRP